MRWIKEWRHPELKCERLGHSYAPVTRSGFCTPTFVGGYKGLAAYLDGVTAFSVDITLPVCSRCKKEDGSKLEVSINYRISTIFFQNKEEYRNWNSKGWFLRT